MWVVDADHAPLPDDVPLTTPYNPGDPEPARPLAPAGTFTLTGAVSGTAEVTIVHDDRGVQVSSVSVVYRGYSDDGIHIIDGTETVTALPTEKVTVTSVNWHSDLMLSGEHTGTKVTSEPDGLTATIDVLVNEFEATGILTTTIDGVEYRQPENGH